MKGFVSISFALLLTAPSVFGGVTLFPAPQPPAVTASPHYRVEVPMPGGWQTSLNAALMS